jgi:WhiB family transcriptional regulator, redox-sensing transcriptional regulator
MNINIFDKRKLEDMQWMKDAACAETPDVNFYPEEGGGTYYAAQKVCNTCIVKEDCLEYALKYMETFGIWGGLGVRTRRRISKQREQAK